MNIDDELKKVRYKITYPNGELGFSAKPVESKEELAEILTDVADMLSAPSKEVIGECHVCFAFILEGEKVFNFWEADRTVTYCSKCATHETYNNE